METLLSQAEHSLQEYLPPGYTMRPPTLADVPATVAMLNAHALATVGMPSFREEELATDWQEPGFTLATDSRVVTAPTGQVVGMIDSFGQSPYVRQMSWGRVHPEHCGLGIGTLLTQWAEGRARLRIAAAPPDARVIVRCQNSDNDRAAAALLKELGYSHVRSTYTMQIELTTPPPVPVWPVGITIRTMIPNQDEVALYRANNEAFRDHWGYVETPFEEGFPLWLHHLHNNPEHDPAFYFMAMDGAEIAGYAFCMPTITDDPEMAWVNNLGVRRPWRRRGLALALLYHIFGESYRRGLKRVGLGVDAGSLTGATRLYEKAGMEIARQYNNYEKELRPGRDLTTQQIV